MESLEGQSPRLVAARIAGIYAIFGILWIVFSDRIVASLVTNTGQLTFIQTIKGAAFVVASSLILFGLVYREHRQLLSSYDDLDSALQHVHILHRILRHNLRNVSSIIGGSIYMISSKDDSQVNEHCEVLYRQNERLINLSEKSRYLKQFLVEAAGHTPRCNLAEIAAIELEKAKREYPHANFSAELPEEVFVNAHNLIDGAVKELIENAVEHNPAENPSVWLSITSSSKWATLTIEDDGPGVPPTERSTLHAKWETPLEHSQGLGLWLVHLTIEESNGEFVIDDGDRGGAMTTVKLPTSQA
ncbi:MAG TPA: ATP-binding protein [Halobacteriales archaeon]|nr:ATP-binding protein [Halobacteriales archaeon]